MQFDTLALKTILYGDSRCSSELDVVDRDFLHSCIDNINNPTFASMYRSGHYHFLHMHRVLWTLTCALYFPNILNVGAIYTAFVSRHTQCRYLYYLNYILIKYLYPNNSDLLGKNESFQSYAQGFRRWTTTSNHTNGFTRWNTLNGFNFERSHFHAEVMMLCGLPASGKSSLCKHDGFRDWPVLSLDELRIQKGFAPHDTSPEFIQCAADACVKFLNRRESFILDSCNVDKATRYKNILFFAKHNAETSILYKHKPYKQLLEDNNNRTVKCPIEKLEKMIDKLEIPSDIEGVSTNYYQFNENIA